MRVVCRAPGKAVLFGEYVVLEGAPALVAALDCMAKVTFVTADAPGAAGAATWHLEAPQLQLTASFVAEGGALVPLGSVPGPLQLVASVLQDAYVRTPLPPGTLTLDTQAFYRGPNKLGLGSSAAVAVAAWHALRAASATASTEDPLLAVRALHSQAQAGTGSGVDVAASTLGGIVRFQLPRLPGSHGATERLASPVHNQDAAHLVPIYTGHGVSTAPFLQAFAKLKQDDGPRYWRCLEPLAQLSAAGCELWALGQTQALLPLVDAYAAAMAELGAAMGMAVVSQEHEAIGALVRAEGAAYKPSGAGGGDVGLAFCRDAKAARRLMRVLQGHGLVPLATRVAPRGVVTQVFSANKR